MAKDKSDRRELAAKQSEGLLSVLKERFERNMSRHPGIGWPEVEARLKGRADKLWSLQEMDRTGGEPDVVGFDRKTGEYTFCDCSAETPVGRRNVCYDREAQTARDKKGVHPAGNVMDMAEAMGIEVLDEEQYRELQKVGEFDTKTQSWVRTPTEIRKLGGALFMDRRFGRVFVYHNTAPCFFSGRGFRGLVRV